MFLKAFVPEDMHEGRWAHLDIAGSMDTTRGGPYQEAGMTGRPVRALVEWARRVAGV
jgi:cytosol aminopeptidase